MRLFLLKIIALSSFFFSINSFAYSQSIEDRVEKLEEQRVSLAKSIYRRKNEIKGIRFAIDSLKKKDIDQSILIDSLYTELGILLTANKESEKNLDQIFTNEDEITNKSRVPKFYKTLTILLTITLIVLMLYFFLFRKKASKEKKINSNWKNKLKRFWYRIIYEFETIRKTIKENMFFDLKIIAFFSGLFLVYLFFFFPHKSYFQTPSLDTMIYLVDRSLRASAVFIGIIISLVILSFQIFNKNYGRYAFIGFFNNRYIKILFTLYVINILFSLYALGYFHEINELNNYARIIFYSAIGLNIILVLCLFPFSVQMLKKSQSRYNLEKVINLIDEKWVVNYDYHNTNNIKNLEIIESNPMKMLQEIGIIAAKGADIVTLELIFDGLYNHMDKLINKHEQKKYYINRYFYHEYRDLINHLFLHVLKTHNYQMVNLLLKRRYDLELFLLDNRLITSSWDTQNWSYKGLDMTFDFEEYFSKSVLEDNDEFAERVIGVYYSYCEYLIREYFPETFKEFDNKKFEEYSNEKHMSSFLFSSNIEKFSNLCIKHNQIGLFKKIFNFFSLESVALSSNNDDSVKIYLLHLMKLSKYYAFEKYLNSGIDSIDVFYFPYLSWVVGDEVKKIKRKSVFNEMKRAMNLAFSKELLNNKILNLWKAIGLEFVKEFKKGNHYKGLLMEVIKQFGYLRSLIKDDCNNYQKDIYLKLHKYLDIIQSHFLKKRNGDEEIEKLFNDTLNDFDKLKEHKSYLEGIGYISNENLF